MSITDQIKRGIRRHLDKELFYLPPSLPSEARMREVFVSGEVYHQVNEPWPKFRTGKRHQQFRAALDTFTQWWRISVAEDPFQKPGYAYLARTDPIAQEIWDIRVVEPDSGIRCFGAFGGRDLFVALTWDYRENIDDFNAEVHHCRAEWDRLFPGLRPFRGSNLDEYVTNYVAV